MRPVDSEEYYGIKILRGGQWIYNGTPINRHNLVKLFASVLKKDDAGDYWLITPYERGRIEVEDVPFMAVEMTAKGSGKSQVISFRTNLDDWVTAGSDHPLRVTSGEEPSPYVLVRDALEARLTRAVYYDLVKLAVEDAQEKGLYGVWSSNVFFPIGRIGGAAS
ncbi:MAG: DUF1285 domain-containing protein [Alphaproteobacteria bacterium]